jgi:inositol phosphorylceramide mannosyltransferase catalytic subunit
MRRASSRPLDPPQTSAGIPKIIHQTYGSHDLPEALRRNVADLKASNPGWDYRFYDDAAIEAFLLEHYDPAIHALYQRINPRYGAARADIFRYLVVYKLGGVYIDIKSRFLRPIDEVLRGDEAFILSQWSNGPGQKYEGFGLKREVAHIAGGEFQQWHVIAAPRHPFLHAVLLAVFDGIDRYTPWRSGTGKVGVIRLTGPIVYTLTIAPLMREHPCRLLANESEIGLEYSVVPGDTHKALFKSHYTASETSVVRLPPHLRLVDFFYQAGRTLKRRFGSA